MRRKIYDLIIKLSNHEEGKILPKWIMFCFFVLFPFKYICWRTNYLSGYQVDRDIWIIEGRKFSSSFFKYLRVQKEGTFRFVSQENGVITIENV